MQAPGLVWMVMGVGSEGGGYRCIWLSGSGVALHLFQVTFDHSGRWRGYMYTKCAEF